MSHVGPGPVLFACKCPSPGQPFQPQASRVGLSCPSGSALGLFLANIMHAALPLEGWELSSVQDRTGLVNMKQQCFFFLKGGALNMPIAPFPHC